MDNERIKILQKVANGELTPEKANEQLFGLSIISGNLTMKVSELKFIPEKPYLSDEISWEIGNIWELHELFPDDKNITVVINKNYR